MGEAAANRDTRDIHLHAARVRHLQGRLRTRRAHALAGEVDLGGVQRQRGYVQQNLDPAATYAQQVKAAVSVEIRSQDTAKSATGHRSGQRRANRRLKCPVAIAELNRTARREIESAIPIEIPGDPELALGIDDWRLEGAITIPQQDAQLESDAARGR